MRKTINKQSLLEICSLLIFSLLMLYLKVSGKYLSYVTPKMAPYLLFCSIIMFIWAVSKLTEIKKPQHKARVLHCLVLLVPILFLILPHSPVSSSGFSSLKLDASVGGEGSILSPVSSKEKSSDSKNFTWTKGGSTQSMAISTPAVSPAASSFSENNEIREQGSNDLIKKYNLKFAADGSIDVPHGKFNQWLNEIFSNMYKYEGVKISIRGFVFRESKTMAANEFVPARMMMSCCSADLVPCGIICSYDKTATLREGSWVTVTGIIHIGERQGKKEPQVSVLSVTYSVKPKEEYVYPLD